MKKFLRFILIGTIWTALFLVVCLYFFVFVWNFNFLSAQDRQFLVSFWDQGGVIKSYADYLFVFSFVFAFVLWLWGLIKALRTNYWALFLKPFDMFRNWEVRRYQSSKRVVLKNIGTTIVGAKSEKEEIADKLKKLEKDLDNNKKTDEIREMFKAKFSKPKN